MHGQQYKEKRINIKQQNTCAKTTMCITILYIWTYVLVYHVYNRLYLLKRYIPYSCLYFILYIYAFCVNKLR